MLIKVYGSLPRRNPLFVKRKMYGLLEKNLNAGQSVVLNGLTNTGKTELIVEYIHEQLFSAQQAQQRYNFIFWVEADNYEKLIVSCKIIAKKLDIKLEEKSDDKLIEEIFEKLQSMEGRWLLIIDGFQAKYDFINKDGSINEVSGNELLKLLSPSSGGDTIITTQLDLRFRGFNYVGVNFFDPVDEEKNLIEFFKKAYEANGIGWSEEYIVQVEKVAQLINYDLSRLTLAVSYLMTALKGDLKKLIALISDKNFGAQGLEIFTKDLADNEIHMLKYCAFLNKNDIPRSLMMNLLKISDVKVFSSLLDTMQAAQLITITGNNLSEYVNVKEDIQKHFFSIIKSSEKVEECEKSQLYISLIQKLSESFLIRRYQEKQNIDDKLVVHIEKIIKDAEEVLPLNFELAGLIVSLANYYRNLDKLSQAENYYNKAKSILEKNEEKIFALIQSISIQDIASAKLSQGSIVILDELTKSKEVVLLYAVEVLHWLGAIQMLKVSSEEQERQSKLEEVIKNLGCSYLIQDYFSKNKKLQPPYKVSDIYYTQRNLANAYLKQGELQKAQDILDRQGADQRFEENDEITVLILLDKGKRNKAEKKIEEAVGNFKKSLKIIIKILSEKYSYQNKNKDMADILAELGNSLYLLAKEPSKCSEKKKLLQEAIFYLYMAEQALITHYGTIEVRKMTKIYEWLAQANFELEQFFLAKDYIKLAIRLQSDIYGEMHEYVKNSSRIEEEIVMSLSKKDLGIIGERDKNHCESVAQGLLVKINKYSTSENIFKLAEAYLGAQNFVESEKYYKVFLQKAEKLKKEDIDIEMYFKAYYGLSMVYYNFIQTHEDTERLRVINTSMLKSHVSEAIKYFKEYILQLYRNFLQEKKLNVPEGLEALKKQYENLLNISYCLERKSEEKFSSVGHVSNIEIFKFHLKKSFLGKLQYYFFIDKGIDIRSDKTQFVSSLIKASANLLPQAEAGMPGVPGGKVTGANLAATTSAVADAIEGNHTSKKMTKIGIIMSRLGLKEVDSYEEAIKLTKNKIFFDIKFDVTFSKIYKLQINKLARESVVELSEFCAYQLLNYLGGSKFNLLYGRGIDDSMEVDEGLSFNVLLSGLLMTSETVILKTIEGERWSAKKLIQQVGIKTTDTRFYILTTDCEHRIYGFAQRKLLFWEEPKYELKTSEQEATKHKDKKSGCVIS